MGSHLYSGGAIAASKRVAIERIAAGDRALFLGVGTGGEVVDACRRGAKTTCIDRSPAMLRRLQKRLDRAGCEATLICGDALAHSAAGGYDVVAAHYFLNLFRRKEMRAALRQAASLLRPGGTLTIADLAPLTGVNRRWVRRGLRLLPKSRLIGVQA
ncbi:MAG: methyltransferase domain-containing protein, partial [Planctomycetota bacterium]